VITATLLRRRRQTLRVWARYVVQARLHRLEWELGRLERVPGAETIHNTRVATRRLRAALRHLEPCFMAQESERLRLEVRRIARLLGQVRDLDILMENLAADARHKGSPLAMLLERLAARRQKTLERSIPEAHKLHAHLVWWRTRLKT
jgi:CHAD domain-containing protein